jgi:hypothetical protein
MICRISWPVPGEAPGVTYTPVSEDACHFFVRSNVTGQDYRIPHRNVYVVNFVGEPQEHKSIISSYIEGRS